MEISNQDGVSPEIDQNPFGMAKNGGTNNGDRVRNGPENNKIEEYVESTGYKIIGFKCTGTRDMQPYIEGNLKQKDNRQISKDVGNRYLLKEESSGRILKDEGADGTLKEDCLFNNLNDTTAQKINNNCFDHKVFQNSENPTNKNAKPPRNNDEKRNRTNMNPARSELLKKYFRINMFPSTEVREELARILDIRPRSVQIWFQNQRQKFRMCKATRYVYPESNELVHLGANHSPCIGINNINYTQSNIISWPETRKHGHIYRYETIANFKERIHKNYPTPNKYPSDKSEVTCYFTNSNINCNTNPNNNYKNNFYGLKLLAEAASIVLKQELQNKQKEI